MSILSDFLDLPLSDTWAARGPSCCGLRPDRTPDAVKRTPMTAAQKAVASLMTHEERQAAATARILRDNTSQSIVIVRPADADKTARIKRGTL